MSLFDLAKIIFLNEDFRDGFNSVAIPFNHPDVEFVEEILQNAMKEQFLK